MGLYALRAKVALEASLRDRQGQAARSLAEARRIEAESDAERTRALELFDADDHDTGETTYGEARRLALQADAHLHEAAQVLEGALLVEPSRPEVRQGLAEVLLQRAELAERWHRRELLATILERLATVDDGGAVLARWHAPASLAIASEPAGAALTLCEYREAEGRLGLHACRAVGPAPQTLTLPPGSYRVTLELPARPSVVYPVALRRAERLEASVPMPEVVPEGFVYVPPGRFLYGSNEPDEVRQVFAAPPLHEARTDGFFIAVHEVTFGEWLTYLRSLPEPERSHRTPSSSHFGASVQLRREPDGRYGLQLTPASRTYAAAEGEPLLYAGRARRAQQDWLRLPVTGVSPLDAEAYARWLAARIPLPGVRLCTEREWERAARGADARRYPHGQELAPEDANIDLTYGRVPEAFGPDEVGTYPASRSPFGVEDMAGNVWEIVRAGEEFVLRGGGFYQTAQAASAWNSDHAAAGSRDTRMGLRLCADARVHLVPWAGSRREAAD